MGVGRRHSLNLLRRNLNRPETLPADSDDQKDFSFRFNEDSAFFAGLTLQVDDGLGGLGVFGGMGLSSGEGSFLVESNNFFSGLSARVRVSLQFSISLLLLLNVFRNLTSLEKYLAIRLILN